MSKTFVTRILLKNKRIEILQILISKDKALFSNGNYSSYIRIKIRRNRVVEDGYAQLMNIPNDMVKNTIRVTFINEHVNNLSNYFWIII